MEKQARLNIPGHPFALETTVGPPSPNPPILQGIA